MSKDIKNVLNPKIKETKEELDKLKDELNSVTPNYILKQSNINQKYTEIQQIIFQYIEPNSNSRGMEQILYSVDRENLVRDLVYIAQTFEEIITISLFFKGKC